MSKERAREMPSLREAIECFVACLWTPGETQ